MSARGARSQARASKYSVTRFYPKGEAKHDEARLVVNTRAERNRAAELAGVPSRGAVTFDRSKGLTLRTGLLLHARKIGEGSYGVAYAVPADTIFRMQLGQLAGAMRHAAVKGAVRSAVIKHEGPNEVIKLPTVDVAGPTAVVKLAKVQGARDVKENAIEAAVHARLATSPCVNVGGARLCASDYVPRIYVAGLVYDTSAGGKGAWRYVTVMAAAPGAPLEKYLRRRSLDADTYLRVEMAACALWASGVVHGDFHKDNVFYDPATRKVTIIDFGFAVVLPSSTTAQVRVAMAQGVRAGVRSLGELWREASRSRIGTGLQAYVNRVVHTRLGTKWYNPDGGALLRLYSRMSSAERAKVPALRARYWGQANLLGQGQAGLVPWTRPGRAGRQPGRDQALRPVGGGPVRPVRLARPGLKATLAWRIASLLRVMRGRGPRPLRRYRPVGRPWP